ncbi:hypothetical protein SAMN02910315_01862 [Methanobrevibacter millerae]|uniref:Uncharacterized protein n=2 Tax=Methanobrevibacter millerae TaxID=230361 RepID=A0A1G5X087_9EURY|nr:hypothetical protein SAMN02910315_01862 [Methanobrevibacter millerae]
MVLSDKMAVKEMKSLDVTSFTVALTGVSTLLSLIVSIILVAAISAAVPNSFGTMVYLLPTIVFLTVICGIFLYFSAAYLYNVLSKRVGTIKFEIENDTILKISTKETALIVGFSATIITAVVYLAFSLILPLILSSFITILMYAAQEALATVAYQAMLLFSNPIYIAVGIVSTLIVTTVFTLLGCYFYNILGDSERGIKVKLSEEGEFTILDSIDTLSFGIAIAAICLILNIILALIMIISGYDIFTALAQALGSFVVAFIESIIIAVAYNFLAPKIGKIKAELI